MSVCLWPARVTIGKFDTRTSMSCALMPARIQRSTRILAPLPTRGLRPTPEPSPMFPWHQMPAQPLLSTPLPHPLPTWGLRSTQEPSPMRTGHREMAPQTREPPGSPLGAVVALWREALPRAASWPCSPWQAEFAGGESGRTPHRTSGASFTAESELATLKPGSRRQWRRPAGTRTRSPSAPR